MKFCANDYDGSYVMHCRDESEAAVFERHLDDIGKCWVSGRKYANPVSWEPAGGGTCYRFQKGVRDQYESYLNWSTDVKILEFSDFDWTDGESHSVEQMSFDEAMSL